MHGRYDEKTRRAKNVILMISDGLGYNGWLASDYYWHGRAGAGVYQRARPYGDFVHVGKAQGALSFVDAGGKPICHDGSALPKGAVKTLEQRYDPDTRWRTLAESFKNDFAPVAQDYTSYTDSAAAATALMSGRKTINGRLNLSWNAAEKFTTVAQLARGLGKAAGVVTSVYASHATPAAAAAHQASREAYEAIFREMCGGLEIVMGCGHPDFDASGRPVRGEQEHKYVGGEAFWRSLREGKDTAFVEEKGAFERLAEGVGVPAKLVGIPRCGGTLQARREGLSQDPSNPSGMAFNPHAPDLAMMSRGALNVLEKNPNGFFLMIEGGAVDWANHDNDLPRMLEEQRDFDRAAGAVVAWVEAHASWDDTLLIVTADHETGGLWGEGTFEGRAAASYDPAAGDRFLGFKAVKNEGKGRMPACQYASSRHTNDLVPLWATGPGSERLAAATRVDAHAARLWGEPYGWDGRFVEATEVFGVMEAAMLGVRLAEASPF